MLTAVLWGQRAQGASMTLSPAGGSYTVDSTFEVTVYLNTENVDINTVRVFLSFPPDKLQVVPRTVAKSIIGVYTSPPRFDNQAGIIDLQGGIPGGINVSSGEVISFTFRVRAVGTATLRFRDESRVLANDGLGTNVLKNTQNAIYQLVLPPPEGPIVVSETHPDQARWYANTNAVLKWTADQPGIEGYSYVLNRLPTEIPDDTAEGFRTSVVYKNLGDGTYYFHIKGRGREGWGGTTHFALNVDASPPADFPVEIIPSARTTRRQPVVQFNTTDAFSGIDHYEFKLVALNPRIQVGQEGQPLFIEVVSPFVTPELEYGSYDLIIRAYDKAGNFREVTKRVKIVAALFTNITGRGLEFRSRLVLPWLWVWIIAAILLSLLAWFAWKIKRWHDDVTVKRLQKKLPSHVAEQLRELKKFQQRYGKLTALLLGIIATLWLFEPAAAQQQIELAPPFVSTISRDISNDEIFYIGGKTDTGNIDVIIYLQNLRTGETTSHMVTSDKTGNWFYRHSSFLSSGNYLLWAQSKISDQTSPPSPQIQMTVRPTAIQFGASRISTELLYLIFVIILLGAVLALGAYIAFHSVHARRKHRVFLKEIHEAEESVKRGFAILRRDIEAELALIKKAKLKASLTKEKREKEDQLLKDLTSIERYIGKEIWDIEKAEPED